MKTAIVRMGNPKLWEASLPVLDFSNHQLVKDISLLKEALNEFRKTHGFGRGIAAPQIGIQRRIIALHLAGRTFVIINPEITWRSTETFSMWDDCMSFPDLLVKLKRHSSISLIYKDEEGVEHTWEKLLRSEAELLQHEIDHLDGILAVDHACGKGSIVYRTEFENHREFYKTQVDYLI